jgi:hypothetical protein
MPGDEGDGVPEAENAQKRGGRPKRKTGGHAEGHLEGHRADRRPRKAAGGHINAAERRKLPSSDFALPGHGEGPEGKGSGSYPIDTEGRARDAISRGSANASPSELATIKRKVHSKYPDMEISGE